MWLKPHILLQGCFSIFCYITHHIKFCTYLTIFQTNEAFLNSHTKFLYIKKSLLHFSSFEPSGLIRQGQNLTALVRILKVSAVVWLVRESILILCEWIVDSFKDIIIINCHTTLNVWKETHNNVFFSSNICLKWRERKREINIVVFNDIGKYIISLKHTECWNKW